MISSAYQYYLSEYGHREASRYDTHKKSELRGGYNNIVRLNKKTPLYKVDLSESTQRLLIDLKENSRIFRNRLYEIFGTADSEGDLQRKTAYSSRPDILNASLIEEEAAPDDKQYSVKVRQLASPQINTGDFVPCDGLGLPAGNYSFDLNIADNAYEFQFKVTEGTDNLSLQEKLARLMNRSNIGITAEVIRDANGSSALEISSTRTGNAFMERIFRFSDNSASRQSGSVEFLGLNNMRRASTNAVIEINGSETSASSNSFTIEKLFRVELKGITHGDETVEIGMRRSSEAIFSQLKLFAEAYNNIYGITDHRASDNPAGQKLNKELNAISGRYTDTLEAIGLSRDSAGYFSVDETRVLQAAGDGTLDRSYSELISFQKSLIRETQIISVNPFEYVNKTMIAYPNPVRPIVTPYQASVYSGILLNGYI